MSDVKKGLSVGPGFSKVRQFQRDYQTIGGDKEVVGLMGDETRKNLLAAQGKCWAKDLRKGQCFSYVGAFKVYEALTDAVADDAIETKVVVVVTDHGLRDRMRTRLDADLLCTLHSRPITW